MKRLYVLTLSLASSVALFAQTTEEIMLANPEYCAGVYLPYPDSVAAATPAPEGYKPFYVSHYGRHGSRYLINESDYTRPLEIFADAAANDNLTPLGQDVYRRLQILADEADGRAGELSPLGYEQHRGIASRLFADCPEVFADGAEVSALSTFRMRCAHSMFAFVGQLMQLNPSLNVPMESSSRHMNYLSYNSPEASYFNRADGPWAAPTAQFKAEKTRPGRLMASLFKNPEKVDGSETMWKLYWVAVDAPNMSSGVDLYDIFTPEELFDLWQVFNYEFYTRNSCNPLNQGLFTDSAKNLLSDILHHADEYVDGNRRGASLRFGHDSTIIPLAGLLHFPTADGNETDPEKLYLTYADYRVSPMCSNVQLRFYRNDAGDVIVKFMFNEAEVPIPCETDIYPYYKWEDARATLQYLLDTPSYQLYKKKL
ncbi:MAG: histidine phosphatase family protein [Muribaculaceae bacterium]|nr:histidine phosphatase family protein [Muribaculaceae bacterium]